jgi:hypothetical protein
MPKFRVQFDTSRQGTLIFDAEDTEHAREIYNGLLYGTTYPDDLEESYEDIEVSDTSYFELTDSSGKFIAA